MCRPPLTGHQLRLEFSSQLMARSATGKCGPRPVAARASGPQSHLREMRLRNPFAFLFGKSRREQYLEQYVLREHARGRQLDEILNDSYIRNRTTEAERARLLDQPEIVAAVGRTVDELKGAANPGK